MTPPPRDPIELLRGLRAIRDYRPDTVPAEILDDILEVGRWSGSASNRQPTEVIVVTDHETRQKLAQNGAGPAANAPVAIVILTSGDADRHELEVFDEGRLVERLLLAARAHGLGGNVATLKGDGPEAMRGVLGVPTGRRLWMVVTIGYIDAAARNARPPRPNQGRKPGEAFVHRERY
ncbi:MAG TPA: nitroreductase family protein [Tepidiformaceae bacterium]|nr:nitroreductase family protein [Tepidiformaceae bacterium]